MLFDALIPSLEEVGARFERGDYFVPEMLIAGTAMPGALDILRPLLVADGRPRQIGTFVMGTVKGDVHDIGKNLVNIMLEGAGFTVIDLGVQGAAGEVHRAIEEHKPDIVGFSAFLTTTMPMFKANINAHREGRPARQGDHHGRRRAGHAGVRRRRRRRRLRGRRLDRRAPGQGADREASGRSYPREAARPHRARGQGPGLGVPDVRAVRAALDRHDLPDDLPEDAAQRAVRRRARGRALRGQARDALRLAEGLRARRGHAAAAQHWREEFNHLRPPVDNRLKGTSSWANFVSGRDRQTPAGWQPGDDG